MLAAMSASFGKGIPFLLLAVTYAGCPVPSLHPLYQNSDSVYVEELEGTWSNTIDGAAKAPGIGLAKETWTFKQNNDDKSSYVCVNRTYNTNGTMNSEVFTGRLVQLGDYLFLDLLPWTPHPQDAFGVPMHLFVRIKIEKETLRTYYPTDSTLTLDGPIPIRHEIVEFPQAHIMSPRESTWYPRIVFTAGTRELRQYMLKEAYLLHEGTTFKLEQ